MATFAELSQQFAAIIQEAIDKDLAQRSRLITSSNVRTTFTYRALLEVKSQVDLLVYTDTSRPLSENDKDQLYTQIRDQLGFPTYFSIRESVQKASNDDIKDLVQTIDNMLKGGRG